MICTVMIPFVGNVVAVGKNLILYTTFSTVINWFSVNALYVVLKCIIGNLFVYPIREKNFDARYVVKRRL